MWSEGSSLYGLGLGFRGWDRDLHMVTRLNSSDLTTAHNQFKMPWNTLGFRVAVEEGFRCSPAFRRCAIYSSDFSPQPLS